VTVVVDDDEALAGLLDRLVLGFILGQQAGGGPFVAVDHEVDEVLAHLTGRPELEPSSTVVHRGPHVDTVPTWRSPRGWADAVAGPSAASLMGAPRA
jgi:hypothetical protein